jgi:hypothetical protein
MTPYEQRRQAVDPNVEFLKLVDEVERHGLWSNEDAVAALSALGNNPQDEVARRILTDQLAPYREFDAISPNPFLPLPQPGAVDGPFRFGKVIGQEENYIGLTEAELNLNIGIFGQIGYGKTVTIVNLLVSILEAK